MTSNKFGIRHMAALVCLVAAGVLLVLVEHPDRGFAFRAAQGDEVPTAETKSYELLETSKAVSILREHYAFQERLVPRRMLIAALQGIEGHFDHVLISPPVELNDDLPGTEIELPRSVTVQMRDQTATFDISEIDDLYQMTWKLMEVFEFFRPAEADLNRMEDAAIEGLLTVLDPHTTYLSEAEYKDMKLSTRGSFGGLGIVISVRKGRLLVMSVMTGTPAAREGLRKGDHIVQIEQESTVNMMVSDAAGRLRGKPGTPVKLWILREGHEEPRSYSVTREIIKVQSVVGKNLDGRTAYVLVKNFQTNTAQQVQNFLDNHYETAPPTGIILDLRGNSGGVMKASVELSDLFLPAGNVVTTVEKLRDGNKTDLSVDGSRYENTALVVLVNHASASASEIVTGALKYRDRAVVLGKRTFGKGSVQYINELGRGALKLTVAQYVGPGGELIQSTGIEPHVELRRVSTAGRLRLPAFADEFEGEEALPFTLDRTVATPVQDSPQYYIRYLPEASAVQEEEDYDYDKVEMDLPIRLAWGMLSDQPQTVAHRLLEHSAELLEDSVRHQEEAIARLAMFEERSWEEVRVPDQPALEVRATLEPAELAAGEEGVLSVEVVNVGLEPLPRLAVRTESTNFRLDHLSCVLGTLSAGEIANCAIKVEMPATSPSRKDGVFLDVETGLQEVLTTTSTTASTKESPLPRLAITYFLDDSAGNGDGLLQVGETVEIALEVTNIGEGPLTKGLATLKNGSGPALFIKSGREEFEDLAPGKTMRFGLAMTGQSAPEEGLWRFDVGVVDLNSRTHFSTTQNLPVGRAEGKVSPVSRFLVPTHPGVPILIGPAEGMPAFGHLGTNGGVQVVAQVGSWYKLQLPGRKWGWARAEFLTEATLHDPAAFKETWCAVEPKFSLREVLPGDLMGEADALQVTGTVDFGKDHAPADCGIAVYRNGRKLRLDYRGDRPADSHVLDFTFKVELESGVNRVLLAAYQKNQSPGYVSMYYNRRD